MPNFSIFDNYEELMLSFSLFNTQLCICPLPESQSLQQNFQVLHKRTSTLFDHLFNTLTNQQHKSEQLSKTLVKTKIKAKKYLTLQKELSSREHHFKLKTKSLTSSIKKLKSFLKRDVSNLEKSLKKQQKTHLRLSGEYNKSLEELESEFQSVFEYIKEDREEEVIDSSAEFEQVMKDLDAEKDEYSRISMEKNPGGWMSDLESSSGSKCEGDDVKNAIGVLLKANLIREDNSLYRLSRFLDDNPESENIELILQLIDIKTKGRLGDLVDTTPMNSILINESSVMQTIVSPGHRVSMFFEAEEQD